MLGLKTANGIPNSFLLNFSLLLSIALLAECIKRLLILDLSKTESKIWIVTPLWISVQIYTHPFSSCSHLSSLPLSTTELSLI